MSAERHEGGNPDAEGYECPHEPKHATHLHFVDDDPLNLPGQEWDEYDCNPDCDRFR